MTDRRRRSRTTRRSERVEIRVTREEERRLIEAAERLHDGSVSELLRRAAAEYLERRATA